MICVHVKFLCVCVCIYVSIHTHTHTERAVCLESFSTLPLFFFLLLMLLFFFPGNPQRMVSWPMPARGWVHFISLEMMIMWHAVIIELLLWLNQTWYTECTEYYMNLSQFILIKLLWCMQYYDSYSPEEETTNWIPHFTWISLVFLLMPLLFRIQSRVPCCI